MKKILIAALVIFATADFALTLVGQPVSYWQGGPPAEANPLGHFLLSRNPVYFALFLAPYLLFLILSINWLVKPLNIIFGAGIASAHFLLVIGWLPKIFSGLPLGSIFYMLHDAAPALTFATIFFMLLIFLVQFSYISVSKNKKG